MPRVRRNQTPDWWAPGTRTPNLRIKSPIGTRRSEPPRSSEQPVCLSVLPVVSHRFPFLHGMRRGRNPTKCSGACGWDSSRPSASSLGQLRGPPSISSGDRKRRARQGEHPRLVAAPRPEAQLSPCRSLPTFGPADRGFRPRVGRVRRGRGRNSGRPRRLPLHPGLGYNHIPGQRMADLIGSEIAGYRIEGSKLSRSALRRRRAQRKTHGGTCTPMSSAA
jgi:hypothetical protein